VEEMKGKVEGKRREEIKEPVYGFIASHFTTKLR